MFRTGKIPGRDQAQGIPGDILLFGAGIVLILIAVGIAVLPLFADSPEGGFSSLNAVVSCLLAAAGAGAAIAGALKHTSSSSSSVFRRRDTTALSTGGEAEKASLYGSGHSIGEPAPAGLSEETALLYEEYTRLAKKEGRVERIHADWAQARKPILRFLKELGFSPEKDLHAQLTFIRDAADDYEDACTLFRESEEELRLFDEELRRSGLTAESLQSAGIINEDNRQDQIRESRQSPAALRRRREEIQEELLQCRAQETDVEDRLADLVREREERDAMREELDELCAQQKKDTASYRQIRMASQLLQKAKESLTSRYADPIRTNFCRYWETITGYAANHVYVDANSHITIGEGGKQRDAALFSTGWRDLTGICLRAALADAMYPAERSERPPLILDDPFTNLDDEKIEGAMHFLEETGRHYQILYFTCSITRC